MPTDLQDIATALHAVAGAIRDTAPKPGPHVVGGPPPKPGERTEADYLREEVREIKNAQNKLWRVVNGLIETVHGHATQLENVWQEIAALRPKCPCCVKDPCDCPKDCECNGGEAAPPALEEAVTELRRLAEHADLIAHDHRHSDIPDHVAAREWERRAATVRECASAIRALAPAQKGGEDA